MNDEKLATVCPISADIAWSAKAAAARAMQDMAHNAPMICIWFDEKGVIRWAKANADGKDLAAFAVGLTALAHEALK